VIEKHGKKFGFNLCSNFCMQKGGIQPLQSDISTKDMYVSSMPPCSVLYEIIGSLANNNFFVMARIIFNVLPLLASDFSRESEESCDRMILNTGSCDTNCRLTNTLEFNRKRINIKE
jgi:hypothetical protein